MSTHHMSRTRIYKVWASMKQRCDNKKSLDYKFYGGRGISYIKRWSDFNKFLKDMGDPPHGLVLDRINNNKNYSKSNCRWVSHKKNCNNRRTSRKILYNGITYSAKELCSKHNVSYSMFMGRLRRDNLSIEKCLKIPSGQIKDYHRNT